jgi:hypothetical protein
VSSSRSLAAATPGKTTRRARATNRETIDHARSIGSSLEVGDTARVEAHTLRSRDWCTLSRESATFERPARLGRNSRLGRKAALCMERRHFGSETRFSRIGGTSSAAPCRPASRPEQGCGPAMPKRSLALQAAAESAKRSSGHPCGSAPAKAAVSWLDFRVAARVPRGPCGRHPLPRASPPRRRAGRCAERRRRACPPAPSPVGSRERHRPPR